MKNFKFFRQYFKFTQEELANKLSLDKQTVASYDADRIKPSIKVILKIIEIYEISFDYFLNGNDCLFPRNLKLLRLAGQIENKASLEDRKTIADSANALLGKRDNLAVSLKQDLIEIEFQNGFQQNLKLIRTHKNMTQTELAEKLGINRNSMTQYENRNFPPVELLNKFSDTLEVSIHALITGNKLRFEFGSKDFGDTILLADHHLPLEQHQVLITLMEAILKK